MVPDNFGDGVELTGDDKPKTGWSASGNMVGEDPDKEVSLQAVFADPGTYTVQFSFKYLVDPGGVSDPVYPEAEIEWSVEGNTIVRRVSVQNGVSISGVAQGVKVRVYDATPDYSPAQNTPYQVSISVAKGLRGGSEMPIYAPSDSIASIGGAAGSFHDFPIPQNIGAKSVRILAIPIVLAAATDNDIVVAYEIGGFIIIGFFPLKNPGGWYPITVGADNIRVYKTVAANWNVQVVFGIDG